MSDEAVQQQKIPLDDIEVFVGDDIERGRARIANVVTVLLTSALLAVPGLFIFAIYIAPTLAADLKSFFEIWFTVLGPILGTAVGFYFGEQRAQSRAVTRKEKATMSDKIPLDELDTILEERMSVYLAGPLTVDPSRAEECRKIRVRAMRVLRTRFKVYDPAEITPPGTEHTADDVFSADHTSTSTADLVFFHVNTPSLGVGIESQIAAEATIPRVIAHPKGVLISRMFEGVVNPTIARIEYTDAVDFEEQLIKLLPLIAEATAMSAKKRRPILKVITSAGIGREIFQSRVLLKLSIDDLAKNTDIRTCMLLRLERDDAMAATLTLMQLLRISKELNATLAAGGKAAPTLHGPANEPHVHDCQRESLGNLYKFVVERRGEWVADRIVLEMWDYAFPLGLQEAEAARGDDPGVAKSIVSIEEWQQIHVEVRKADSDQMGLFEQ